jgi:hypothetical protein
VFEEYVRHLDYITSRLVHLTGSGGNDIDFQSPDDEVKEFYPEVKRFHDLSLRIFHLCYAISPRSLFGVLVLCMMDLTVSDIEKMTQDEAVAFASIMAPAVGKRVDSYNPLVPPALRGLVDAVVEGILPTLE